LSFLSQKKKGKSTNALTDETRPTCNRCKKAGYKCQGYDRVTIFVDETDWVQSKHGIDKLISDAASDSLSPKSTPSDGDRQNRGQSSQSNSEAAFNRSLQQLASVLATNSGKQVSTSVLAFIQGILSQGELGSSAWSYTTSADTDETDTGSGADTDSFANAVVMSIKGGGSITKRPSLPRMIIQAVALALYGRKSGDTGSIERAAHLYGYAVRQVGSDLRKPNLASNQMILTSILNLGLYDVSQDVVLSGCLSRRATAIYLSDRVR
jgi:hypothetical protein